MSCAFLLFYEILFIFVNVHIKVPTFFQDKIAGIADSSSLKLFVAKWGLVVRTLGAHHLALKPQKDDIRNRRLYTVQNTMSEYLRSGLHFIKRYLKKDASTLSNIFFRTSKSVYGSVEEHSLLR
jgi:hypothetical protein